MIGWVIVLTIAWAAVSGSIAVPTIAGGIAAGTLVAWLARPALPPWRRWPNPWRALRFGLFYLWELVLSSLRVAYDVLSPEFRMRPGIISLELDARSDLEIMVLVNLISLTPGSLAVDVSADRTTLYVHSMYLDDEDLQRVRETLKAQLESPVLELLR